MTRTDASHKDITPREWFRGELCADFWDVFNVAGFTPDTEGFIMMAETETQYAAELGVRLMPMDVALYLIDCWKAVELRA